MNKITDVQISCVNRVIIWSQTKSSENWMPALHRGTTHKEKGQPLPMQGCVPMKTSPCLILVYVFSFATGQKLYVSHIDSTCQCWYQSLRWVLHAAGLLVAIQSIHDFRNINSSSKQLPQPHPRLRYTSTHMLIRPPGISISNVSSFCKKKDLQIQHPTAKMTFQAAVTIKLITSEPSHLGHNVTCGGWSNLSAKETCSYDKIWPECWRDLPHKKSENFTKTDGKIYTRINWYPRKSTALGMTSPWLPSPVTLRWDSWVTWEPQGWHWARRRAWRPRVLAPLQGWPQVPPRERWCRWWVNPQERASPHGQKKAFLFQWFLGL